jgi:PEP-CTERM motif
MKLFATAAILAGLTVASAANAGVVFSEGFDGYTLPAANGPHTAGVSSTSGNSFTTDYSFRTGTSNTGANSMYDEGTWTIGANPFAVHSLWVDTSGNTNPFLMLNGAASPPSGPTPVAWESQGVTVAAGTYKYSYDLLNVCCNASDPGDATALSPLQLWYTAPGGSSTLIDIGPLSTTPGTAFGWETVSGTFTVAAGGSVHIGLVDQSGVPGGNDFGVDNISLASVPEPASWALMITGFGAAGAMLRRRRQAAVAA